MSKPALLGLALAASSLGACAQHVYSPPSRAFALESARTVGAQRVGVAAQVGAQGALFGPSISAAESQVRYGVADDVEVSGQGTYAYVADEPAHHVDPSFYMGRAGVKVNPGGGALSLTGGVGGGYAAAGGGFAAGDLGAIVSYNGCTFIPFAGVGGFVSQPLDPHPVDVTEPADKMPVYDTPSTTVGMTITSGLKIAFRDRCTEAAPPVALTIATGATRVSDHDSEDGFFGLALGVEAAFE